MAHRSTVECVALPGAPQTQLTAPQLQKGWQPESPPDLPKVAESGHAASQRGSLGSRQGGRRTACDTRAKARGRRLAARSARSSSSCPAGSCPPSCMLSDSTSPSRRSSTLCSCRGCDRAARYASCATLAPPAVPIPELCQLCYFARSRIASLLPLYLVSFNAQSVLLPPPPTIRQGIDQRLQRGKKLAGVTNLTGISSLPAHECDDNKEAHGSVVHRADPMRGGSRRRSGARLLQGVLHLAKVRFLVKV